MRVGIVVPYSWSFPGGVVDHAEQQSRALQALGVDTRILIGYDPPGLRTRLLHPGGMRTGAPPAEAIALGGSVIAPGNGSLPNIVLSPAALLALRRTLARERFDVLHVHEPLTPALGAGALALGRSPIVATFHAAGRSSWRWPAKRSWGFLLERLDHRIAVSQQALETAHAYAPAEYELLPNGVELPDGVEPDGRARSVVFLGRHEPRKGLPVLLRAWPEVHRRTGARLRLIGVDPSAARLLLARLRVDAAGVELLGVVPAETLSAELAAAKLLVAPAVGNESFGMVIAQAFAHATPVVASDIPGYRSVVSADAGLLVPPGDAAALADALVSLVDDEPRRRRLGEAAREVAASRFAWPTLARRLVEIYGELVAGVASPPAARDAPRARVTV